jgi:UDP-N-acetylglucosamine 4,6-dehydratase/5-epimerase
MNYKSNKFKNKTIIITGATGYFGKHLIAFLIKNFIFKKLIIFSRDEQKHHKLRELYKNSKIFSKLRFFIGDVRDRDRLNFAFQDCDIVIHAAAIKHVSFAEENPMECIKTNIIGAENIVHSSLQNNVEKVLALSTDKASNPINLYGATKLCSDKIFTSAEQIKGNKKIKFSVVRYGNVSGSTGSILETLKKNHQENKDTFNLTDKNMTRFWITANQALEFVLYCLDEMKGGEIFIPKIPSIKIYDLVKSFRNIKKINIIGIKPGEKIHESMFTKDECHLILKAKKSYIISPNDNMIDRYKSKNYHLLNKYYDYRSDTNNEFLNMDQIKKLIEN